MDWHSTDLSVALEKFNTDKTNGLTSSEAQARSRKYGPNEVVEQSGRTPLRILWEQTAVTMTLVLLAATLAVALLGNLRDAFALLAVIVIRVLAGFFQEYPAERTLPALKRIATSQVAVVRDGKQNKLSARELVPGDVVRLETGSLIPADLRLLEADHLQVHEAALTGEAEPVVKMHTLEAQDVPFGNRHNMAYLGTRVTAGDGRGLVVATGLDTELGRVLNLVQKSSSQKLSFKNRFDRSGKTLIWAGAGIAALIFGIGFLRGNDLNHMLLAAVSVAVAVVPAGLPLVVTITWVLGARRMRKRGALIRRLSAIETLDAVTVVCSDKTGTLTENRMTVIALDVAEHRLDMTEEVHRGGVINLTFPAHIQDERDEGKAISAISLSAIGGALCNDASLLPVKEDEFTMLGDRTEGALLAAAAHLGYWKDSLDSSFPRVAEQAFDPERKRMTTVHSLAGHDPDLLVGLPVSDHRYISFTKGAVDGLLDISSRIWVQGEFKQLNDGWRARIQAANDEMTAKGMRVLGIAFRLLDDLPASLDETFESSLTMVGLFGMIDPPRPEVQEAVAACKSAGIRPVMITGDHPRTALEIARQLGIVNGNALVPLDNENAAPGGNMVLTGPELERLSPNELRENVEAIRVFAHIFPEQKLKIVEALSARGHVVAMTGEGLKDAPALRRADVGIGMGVTGTDIVKGISDLVLSDDNFATLVAALGEGRKISDNLRRFLQVAVAGAIGKALALLLAPFSGPILPLLPLQLLWLHLLTDGLLGLGMGVEDPGQAVIKRPPPSPGESALSRNGWPQAGWVGGLIGALALALGAYYFFSGQAQWRTMVFTFLAFAQVFQALASRSNTESLFKVGLLSNPLLAGMALLVIALQLAVLYVPALSAFFNLLPLSACDLSIAAGAGVLVMAALEVGKLVRKQSGGV